MSETVVLGNVTITRVEEWQGPFAPPEVLIPGTEAATWQENRSWLSPDHWEAEANLMRACVQTWVLKSEGRTILVDTGVGNGKARPHMQEFDHLDLPFLASLDAAGVKPADVDMVICTHAHIDHVGWNTQLEEGGWHPTFPNAEYVFSRADIEFWNPENNYERRGQAVNENVFEDSVEPVLEAGLGVLWEDSRVVDGNLRIDLAAGHTPGMGAITLRSGSDLAVFVGDLAHSPVQVLEPELNSCFCEDERAAVRTRRRLLSWAADNHALVLPGHFCGGHAVEVARDGDKFKITGWGGFSGQ
jgi:glyoxylase-like metal-dependent hydrolase (beta-lactamase superfamily II)